jgi:hypothetical protein
MLGSGLRQWWSMLVPFLFWPPSWNKHRFRFCSLHLNVLGNILPNRLCAANMSLPLVLHQYIGADNYYATMYSCCKHEKKSAKSDYWCCMLTVHHLLVQLARFYKYIGLANILVILFVPDILFVPKFRSFHLAGCSCFLVVPVSSAFRFYQSFQSF